jgi:hypothetical protein
VDRSQQVTQAPDGRSPVFAEWGDLDGSPVFALAPPDGGGMRYRVSGLAPIRPPRSIRAK